VNVYITGIPYSSLMKEQIRSAVMEKRRCLAVSEVLEKSRRIKQRVFALDEFKEAQRVLFYVSYDNEVSTHEMIKESLAMGKQVIVPKVNKRNRSMSISLLTRWEDLEACAYNILEPKPDCIKEVPVHSIDLMIVPGVVFDSKGNRIGHGFGYFDRLLQNCKKAHVLGLAFECQLVDSIPAETHDVCVEKIVTEERIIICR
jgi:5-formyltetrahydrofolate cyclo-ligase